MLIASPAVDAEAIDRVGDFTFNAVK